MTPLLCPKYDEKRVAAYESRCLRKRDQKQGIKLRSREPPGFHVHPPLPNPHHLSLYFVIIKSSVHYPRDR